VQFLHNKGATSATISFVLELATSLSHQCKSIAFSITSLVLQDLQVNVSIGSVVDISII
jgi:hypothetical protein